MAQNKANQQNGIINTNILNFKEESYGNIQNGF